MFSKLKKTIGVLLLATGLMFGGLQSAQAAFVPADIVYVIDYSGSMGNDINQVIANIGAFQTALTNAGIDAQYGAVQFGQSANGGNPIQLTDLTTAAGLSAALTAALPVTGGFEPGSLATSFALANTTFRAGSVKNIILITDEPDNSTNAQFLQADADLTANSALFNAIAVPGFGNTNQTYGVLAANHGGQLFDINQFRADPATFLANFNATKVQEILEAPEPSIMALMGIGLAGLGFSFRRRTRRIEPQMA